MSRLNQKIKRQEQTIIRLREQLQTIKFNFRQTDTTLMPSQIDVGVQCNSMENIINDLHCQVDDLHCQLDENNNKLKTSNIDDSNTEKVLNFRVKQKGNPYDGKLRKLYYVFLSRNIGLEHINPLIKGVLQLIYYNIEDLPSIATASKMSHEIGSICRQQLSAELSNAENLTMHREATTKKGRHFYGIEFSTSSGNTLTAGLREIVNGKAETYVKHTNEISEDICSYSNILMNPKKFMTGRSATEKNPNKLLSLDLPDKICNQFKCSVHPLLQFSDLCQR
ncbi:unnamed protein product [Mytilus coruscus]|uniref:Uncharacterized protein n=1 Tax=Mytilus coruscus TaxID=42192 RepID=A0A6J8EYW2_MYTCO|nr:unnamed protein product [Mytilus coruscus]